MTTVTATPSLGSFSAVDTEPGAATLIAVLDEQASIPAIQRLRAAATELLGVRLGHHLVDVGCGTGDVARALAGRVGPTGTVLGIDASETMLTEARRRAGTTTLPVEFRPGDITNLELDDATCDGALCERVFQHVASPHKAMAELVRITRPGGRIVVIDTDWGLHAIHGADPTLTAAIVDCWARNAANGLAGRQLPTLFADAGLRDPNVDRRDHDQHRPTATLGTALHRHGRRGVPRRGHQRGRRRHLAEPARRRRSLRPLLLGRDDVRGRQPSPLTIESENSMSLFAVHREAGPAWTEGKGAFDQPGVSDHAAFMNGLADDGLILAAGPLAGTESGRIRVLLIADGDHEAEIVQRLAADPWELTGRITTTRIEPWTLLVGALSPPALEH